MVAFSLRPGLAKISVQVLFQWNDLKTFPCHGSKLIKFSCLNIVHIPDKPGQSHNTQEFERTLSEVFTFDVLMCLFNI